MPKNEGIQATAVGTQIAKEATQQAVGKQSNAEAGRDVVITEQELAAQVKPLISTNQYLRGFCCF